MAPDVNILEQCILARRILGRRDRGEPVGEAEAAELAQLVMDMNGWLCKGGAMPGRWRRTCRAED